MTRPRCISGRVACDAILDLQPSELRVWRSVEPWGLSHNPSDPSPETAL